MQHGFVQDYRGGSLGIMFCHVLKRHFPVWALLRSLINLNHPMCGFGLLSS